MRKRSKFYLISSLAIIFILTACSSNTEKLNPDLSAPIVIDSAVSDAKINENKVMLKLVGNRKVLGNAFISSDGMLPIEEMTNTSSKIFLLDIHHNTYELVSEKSLDIAFLPAYQDKDLFIYFEYQVGGLATIPIEYYIYDKKTKEKRKVALKGIIKEHAITTPDTTIIRINNNLYFEVQDRERITKVENDWDNGLSIYKYNLETQKIEFVVAGMSPRTQNNELYYIKNTPDVEGILMNYDRSEEIISGINEYAIFDDMIMYSKLKNDEFSSYLLRDKQEEYLFSHNEFWHYNINTAYLTWQQPGENLYVYDLAQKQFIILSTTFGSNYATASEKYLFWTEATFNPKNKSDVETTLIYVEI